MDTQPQKRYKILLIGDDCQDIYQYGSVDRLSPEAPVPIFCLDHSISKPGMAANVRENLLALGCDVSYYHGSTSQKTRLIDSRSRQHIVRIDRDQISPSLDIDHMCDLAQDHDIVIISDYGKGSITYDLIQALRRTFYREIFVDTKKTDLNRLEGCTVKINQLEHSRAKTLCSDLVVTLGRDGARWKDQYYPAPGIEVVDVTGAGDTFLAALAFQWLVSNDMPTAIKFAISASSVTVRHLGVYAPTLEEIQ